MFQSHRSGSAKLNSSMKAKGDYRIIRIVDEVK